MFSQSSGVAVQRGAPRDGFAARELGRWSA